jgi:hypothetical protein
MEKELNVVKRFEPSIDSSDCFMGMVEREDGDYVLYDDIKHLLETPSVKGCEVCPHCGIENDIYENKPYNEFKKIRR